jgi:hypothetical protein
MPSTLLNDKVAEHPSRSKADGYGQQGAANDADGKE